MHGDNGQAGTPLSRHLGLLDLTLLGIGGTIGAGIFVITGTAAANYAGPAVALSFVVAGIASLCAALCYAEMASAMPAAGSAYTYAYATLGESVAWLIGWNLILEYLLATSTVAVGWSGYVAAMLESLGFRLPRSLATAAMGGGSADALSFTGMSVNLPAMLVVLMLSAILHRGIRGSALFNNAMVVVKVLVVLLVIGCGVRYTRTANWQPFIPPNTGHVGEFGWSGVVRAAGVVFFAYIGFDMISCSALEARNPRRDIPLSILLSLGICTVLYVAMCLVVTGMVPYRLLNVPHPIYLAVEHAGAGLAWLRPVIGLGVIFGLCSAMLVTLYGQTRIFYAMSCDGLLPAKLSEISPRFRTPAFGTWFVGVTAALLAGLLPIDVLGQLVSIGTLFAFGIICVSVLVLRRTQPELQRPFRTPAVWIVGCVGAITTGYMMVSLPAATWLRFGIWTLVGAGFYRLYGSRHSRLRNPLRSRSAFP